MNFGLSDQELEFEFACAWKIYHSNQGCHVSTRKIIRFYELKHVLHAESFEKIENG
jgi:hypothetical protein